MDLYLELCNYVAKNSRSMIKLNIDLGYIYLYNKICYKLRIELTNYLDILLSNKYSGCLNYKKLLLNNSIITDIFNNQNIRYLLSKMCYNKNMYINFDDFIKVLIEKLRITEYKNMDSIITETIKNNYEFDSNNIPYENETVYAQYIKRKSALNLDKYREFDRHINSSDFITQSDGYSHDWLHAFKPYMTHEDLDWIYAEYMQFRDLYKNIKNENIDKANIDKYKDINSLIRWISRFDGDGYGFDIMKVNEDFSCENVIEVKQSKIKQYFLTNNEVNMLEKFTNYKNTNYFVNLSENYLDYTNKAMKTMKYNRNVYVLDKDTLKFVNILDSSDRYEISNMEVYTNKKQLVKVNKIS